MTSALDRGGWSTSRPTRLYPRERSVPHLQEVGWAPGPVWIGAENLALIGIRSPGRSARSESLYRLRYPGSLSLIAFPLIIKSQVRSYWIPTEGSVSCYDIGFSGATRQINRPAATSKHSNIKMSRPQILYCGRVKFVSGNERTYKRKNRVHTYIHTYVHAYVHTYLQHKKEKFLPPTFLEILMSVSL
jgi:hypothetical protein